MIADFLITETFGVDPLQQYLVLFPDGRRQALPWAWDSRPREQGGQRWHYLLADEPLTAGDPLHWTGRDQNWNFMCASCHSTGLERRYDAASDRYDTSWTEISVGCESCHGAGAAHVAWAQAGGRGTEWIHSGEHVRSAANQCAATEIAAVLLEDAASARHAVRPRSQHC